MNEVQTKLENHIEQAVGKVEQAISSRDFTDQTKRLCECMEILSRAYYIVAHCNPTKLDKTTSADFF